GRGRSLHHHDFAVREAVGARRARGRLGTALRHSLPRPLRRREAVQRFAQRRAVRGPTHRAARSTRQTLQGHQMNTPVLSLGGVSAGEPGAREHNNRGVLRHVEGDLETASAEYQAALECDPNNATAHNNFGYLCAQQGRWADAIGHYERSLALDPQHGMAAANLGVARAATGNVPAGIAALARSVEIDPHNLAAWDNLAKLCMVAGRIADAEAAWRSALELAPDDPASCWRWERWSPPSSAWT